MKQQLSFATIVYILKCILLGDSKKTYKMVCGTTHDHMQFYGMPINIHNLYENIYGHVFWTHHPKRVVLKP